MKEIITTSKGFVPADPGKYKTPLNKRLKNSKFAKLISEFTDEEIKALAYCLVFKPRVRHAIDMYSKAVDNSIQIEALRSEFLNRQIQIKNLLPESTE
jgi:hypothetical protein